MQRKQQLITILAGTEGWFFDETGTAMMQFEFDTFGILLDTRDQQCEILVSGEIFQIAVRDIKYV